jgi:hypothetical protein
MLSNVLSISFFSRDEQGNGPIEASFFASMGTVLLYSVIIRRATWSMTSLRRSTM